VPVEQERSSVSRFDGSGRRFAMSSTRLVGIPWRVGSYGGVISSVERTLVADAAEVYGKYIDELTRFATVIVGPSAAADVAAETALRALAAPNWPEVHDQRAYLHRAVLHHAVSLRRSTARREAREVDDARRRGSMMHDFVRVEVIDAMRRLTPRQRAVVYFTYWCDDAVATIAHRLGLSHRTVERELSLARRHLEVLLK
jgi:DNA-directed RNA polymerase specialized sigma24 family protein